MLIQLIIKNFALIKHTEINFFDGFNVITGETGTGKSIIINATKLLLGSRATPDIIRNNEEEASVEGLFEVKNPKTIKILNDLGIELEENGELIIKRIISAKRNKIYINGSLFNLKDLITIGNCLFNISSQFEYHNLLNQEEHITILDDYCNLNSYIEQYHLLYFNYTDNIEQLRKLEHKKSELNEKKEFYDFIKKEVDLTAPFEGEMEKIENEIDFFENIDGIKSLYKELIKDFHTASNSINTILHNSIDKFTKYQKYIENSSTYLTSLQEFYYVVENLTEDFKNDLNHFERVDMEKYSDLFLRQDELVKLYKKYGGNEEKFFQKWNEIINSLNYVKNIDIEINELKIKTEKQKEELLLLCDSLHIKRVEISTKLNDVITENLHKMGMKGSEFKINISKTEHISERGTDFVEFLIKTNVDGEFKPIREIASGGELSRILLSIKSLLIKNDEGKTYIFDEVDSGIGGETANYIGQILQQISNKTQIIVITHLIQVASRAKHHFSVSKWVTNNETISEIKILNNTDREKELSRMIGNTDETSITYVKNLLKEVKNGI